MKREFAAHNARPDVKPPTKEERAYATASGLGESISSEQLRDMRAQARRNVRLATAQGAKSTGSSPAVVETVAERKLKRKIERLENENCKLKVKIMNGK